MTDLLGVLGVAVVVFASTNVDDVFLLAAFFADRHLRAHSVVLGQFLGIGALVAASAAAAWASLAVPDGYPAMLGAVPLALGIRKLWGLRRAGGEADLDDVNLREEERAEHRTYSQVLAVAGVTVANGGDNLGVYIPLFARDPYLVPLYSLVFAMMTALWCFAAYRLVQNRMVGVRLRRYGHVALPIVLIALGVWLLTGVRVLLR
ncbi:MAG TPA: cadmium resistance transporter [Longimicrobiaceae bacterium]|nr:cadmium resistance transporter [Longimicrobiaceae bacterium]